MRGRELEREAEGNALLRARERHALRTARLQTITAALSRAVTSDEIARTLVSRALDAVGAHEGGVWLVEPGGAVATLAFGAGLHDEARRSYPLAPPAALPIASTMVRGEPIFVESRREAEARWPEIVERCGTHVPLDYSFACLPLEAEGRAIGAAAFVVRSAHRFEDDERVFLAVLARQAAQALLRARAFEAEHAARAAAEAAERRAAFLAEASAILSSSLDWEATMTTAARLAVPAIADWCAVDVPESLAPGGRPVVVTHVDPAKVALAQRLRERYPPDPAGATGAAAVLRTGRSELYPEIPDALLRRAARDAEMLAALREVGLTSAMIVPIRARGRTLGAVTLVAAESGRRYGPADLAMAEELGRRAGVALDNARLYDDAQRAIRGRDDVLAIVSHDLKNPLESVMLSASMLLRGPESPRVRRYAEAMQRSVARMDRLIRELLDLSSLDAGRFRVEARPEPLEEVIGEALAVLAPLALEKDIALRAEGLPLGEHVPLDRERMLQVLSNLVGNALQYAPRGGNVVVRPALATAHVQVEVQDDGPGIPPEDLPRVFDRFWKGRAGGTGLGLSIARGIVEAHGGRIRAESRVGAGTTFVFTLPRGSRAGDGR